MVTPNVEVTGAARLYRAASSDRRERGRPPGWRSLAWDDLYGTTDSVKERVQHFGRNASAVENDVAEKRKGAAEVGNVRKPDKVAKHEGVQPVLIE